METGERIYGISEAARILSLSAEWLRQGERRGSLPKARRDRNGHRYYTAADLESLRNRRLIRGSNV
jgi:DNA-binding transcriptional MerR regulator